MLLLVRSEKEISADRKRLSVFLPSDDDVRIEIDADDIGWRFADIKVSRINADNEWKRCAENITQCERTKRNVSALPLEWKENTIHGFNDARQGRGSQRMD